MYLVKRIGNSNMPDLPKLDKPKSLEKRFRIRGFRLMSYDAKYEKTMFEYTEKRIDGSRIIEVEEINSGIRFCFEIKEGK